MRTGGLECAVDIVNHRPAAAAEGVARNDAVMHLERTVIDEHASAGVVSPAAAVAVGGVVGYGDVGQQHVPAAVDPAAAQHGRVSVDCRVGDLQVRFGLDLNSGPGRLGNRGVARDCAAGHYDRSTVPHAHTPAGIVRAVVGDPRVYYADHPVDPVDQNPASRLADTQVIVDVGVDQRQGARAFNASPAVAPRIVVVNARVADNGRRSGREQHARPILGHAVAAVNVVEHKMSGGAVYIGAVV